MRHAANLDQCLFRFGFIQAESSCARQEFVEDVQMSPGARHDGDRAMLARDLARGVFNAWCPRSC